MELKALLVDSKTTWVDFPGLDGFEVELANLSRKELVNLRKRCTSNKFNRKTRGFEESLDEEKFVKEFSQATVKGWKGLKVKHLPLLLPVDISGDDGEEEIPYSQEEALSLITNSTVFDQFVTDTMNEFEQFSITKKETDVKNLKSSSGTSSKQGE